MKGAIGVCDSIGKYDSAAYAVETPSADDGRPGNRSDFAKIAPHLNPDGEEMADGSRRPHLFPPRVALTADPVAEFCSATFGIWISGKVVVPLAMRYPDKEITHILNDSNVSAVVCTPDHVSRLKRIVPKGAHIHVLPNLAPSFSPIETKSMHSKHTEFCSMSLALEKIRRIAIRDERPALMLYTSGTTGLPKGVIHTHGSLSAQISSLLDAWEWSCDDRMLHSLPLHHIHGFVNALCCPLACGAKVKFLPKFSPQKVWMEFNDAADHPTVFMGVPTMYNFLLQHYDSVEASQQALYRNALKSLRVAICGSAACPIPLLERWRSLAGTCLLERYGMTETGMILGNPLHGKRVPGTVGKPFAGVNVRCNDCSGELEVYSKQLFSSYWNREEETRKAFTEDGYFKTGDTAEIDTESGYFRLLGRTSVDIIKRGGYKVSALEIESAILEDERIGECAVLGQDDPVWGERILAIVVPREGCSRSDITIETVRDFLSTRLAKHKLPDELECVGSLPRNAMGKINKKTLRKDISYAKH